MTLLPDDPVPSELDDAPIVDPSTEVRCDRCGARHRFSEGLPGFFDVRHEQGN